MVVSHEPMDRLGSSNRVGDRVRDYFEGGSMSLTALKVRYAKPGRHSDVHGLCLVMRPNRSRTWVLRMQHNDRRREFGLGPAHNVPLADAQCRAMDIHKMVRAGLDPVVEHGLRRANLPTFETVARDCYESLREGWKDQRCKSWLSSWSTMCSPRSARWPNIHQHHPADDIR